MLLTIKNFYGTNLMIRTFYWCCYEVLLVFLRHLYVLVKTMFVSTLLLLYDWILLDWTLLDARRLYIASALDESEELRLIILRCLLIDHVQRFYVLFLFMQARRRRV